MLSINEREELYAREEFQDIIKVDLLMRERKLEITKENVDRIIVF